MKNILALLKLAKVIPVSAAEAERGFSMVNRVLHGKQSSPW